jgi:hypothetical protein
MIYAKIGAAVALLLGAFWAGWTVNGDRAAAAANALHAAQLQAAVTALDTQASQRVAAEAKLAKVQGDYDAIKDIPDPVSVGLAHRLLVATPSACSGPMPSAPAVAGGAADASRVAIGPSVVEQRLNDYIQACGRDAKKLVAAQALAPK